jgi:hypothetical protein
MKTEDHSWQRLHEHAAAQITPGFADRVLRAARAGANATPLLMREFALCAATAALCLAAVVIYHATSAGDENARNLAGWQEIVSQADELDQTL